MKLGTEIKLYRPFGDPDVNNKIEQQERNTIEVSMSKPVIYPTPQMRRIERIHFVGIGGSGMCGIAEVLNNLGYEVTGSDLAENNNTLHLSNEGVRVFKGHDACFAEGADVVVVSTAIDRSNPEVQWAHEHRVPVVPRAEMLGELMRYRHGIAVAGTHGKTTTTSLIATVLAEGELDPTFVIGGLLKGAKVNARLGSGRVLVAEADESDASFLHLQPQMIVVTNVDADHMETYQGDFELLKQAFVNFIHNLPFYGLAILCGDDDHLMSLTPDVHRAYVTYGFAPQNDYRALEVKPKGLNMCFDVVRPEPHARLSIQLSCVGQHNVLNALAAIAVATEEGVCDEAIIKAMKQFRGVGRRFEVYSERVSEEALVTVVDDYGHHPRELAVVLEAARAAWPDQRIVMLFEPHRYTRTRDLFDDFVEVLSQTDGLFLLDVYAAGESPIVGVDSESLSRSIASLGGVQPIYIPRGANVFEHLGSSLRSGDVLITQGAGKIGQLAQELLEKFPSKESLSVSA